MPRQRSSAATEGLGRRLRRLRLARGLTQADLAAPDYTHAYVSTIESGRRVPSDQAVDHFASKLGVEPEEILTGRSRALVHELELEIQRARADISGDGNEHARYRLRKVVDQAREIGDRRLEARAEEIWGLAEERRGKPDAAVKRFERAIALYREDSPTAAAVAVAGKVRILQTIGESHHAVFVGEHYLDQLERSRMTSPSAKLRVLSPMVLAYLSGGFHSKAGEVAQQCLALMPRVNDAEALAIAHVNVAAAELAGGHFDDSARSLQKAEQLFEALELQLESGIVHLARGHVEARRGKFRNARQHLRQAIEFLGATGNHIQQANAALELGRVDRLEGRLDDAIDRLRDALDVLPPDGQWRLRAWGHRELALTLTGVDPKESEKHFRTAIDIYEQIDEPIELARTHAWLGDQRFERDDTVGALDAYRESSRALEQWPDL